MLMAKVVFEIKSIPPFRNVKGQFTKANENLLKDKRDFMRSEGKRMTDLAQQEAPKGKTGKFAKGIRYKTFLSGTEVGFNVTTPQPLGRYILEGTKPHRIVAKRAKALFFYWPKVGMNTLVPRKGWYMTGPDDRAGLFFIGKGYVNHPGTKPNKFMSRAYRRWLPGARQGLNQISRNYIRYIMGASPSTIKV